MKHSSYTIGRRVLTWPWLRGRERGVYYRGTSLIGNSAPLGPYSRIMSRAIWCSKGGVVHSKIRHKPQERVVCEGNRDPGRTITPAGGLSLRSCWSCINGFSPRARQRARLGDEVCRNWALGAPLAVVERERGWLVKLVQRERGWLVRLVHSKIRH